MATEATVGEFTIQTIFDHMSAPRDPSVVFPDVPAEAWAPYREIGLNSEGMWQPPWRGHLIRRTDGTGPLVLVDTGMGPGPHAHTGRNGELLVSLAAVGVAPEQIDAVVTTHTHGDHIGWNVTWDGETPRPTFPDATYHVARNDWDYYSQPGHTNEAFQRSVAPLASVAELNLVVGEIEIAPGITTMPANGHTPGHQVVMVRSGGEVGAVTGDLFHSVAQVTEPAWRPTFDWDTEMSTASRTAFLDQACAEGWTVFSGHLFIGVSIGKVVERESRRTWAPE